MIIDSYIKRIDRSRFVRLLQDHISLKTVIVENLARRSFAAALTISQFRFALNWSFVLVILVKAVLAAIEGAVRSPDVTG